MAHTHTHTYIRTYIRAWHTHIHIHTYVHTNVEICNNDVAYLSFKSALTWIHLLHFHLCQFHSKLTFRISYISYYLKCWHFILPAYFLSHIAYSIFRVWCIVVHIPGHAASCCTFHDMLHYQSHLKYGMYDIKYCMFHIKFACILSHIACMISNMACKIWNIASYQRRWG